MIKEFKDFINRGNVVDMAVGIIMGASFTTIVNSLVKDVIMPPIGKITGGMDFSNYFINLSPTEYATLAEAQKAGAATINYGVFINAVLNFAIVAFAVFLLVKGVNRLRKAQDALPSSPSKTEELLTEIRDALKKS
ncbi:MAG: large conductance mechanosensitive channel protein MscL [Alphaproteobacteria bacterium]